MKQGSRSTIILNTPQAILPIAFFCIKKDPVRQNRAIEIEGPSLPSISNFWPLKDRFGNASGHISSAIWSPDFQLNVTIGMVHREVWDPSTELQIETPAGTRVAIVKEKFWI